MDLLILVIVALVVYFLPWIVAECRGHTSAGAILIFNLLLGWTFLFWVIALVWACTGSTIRRMDEEALRYKAILEGRSYQSVIDERRQIDRGRA